MAYPISIQRAVRVFRLLRTKNLNNLVAWILFSVAALLAATLIVNLTYSNLRYPWTSVRLAPTFALSKGYPLYSTTTQPPWVMVGYGPLYPLMYAPSLLASTPGPVVSIATVLAQGYILLPVCLLIRLATAGENRPWLQPVMVTVLLYPLFLLLPSLRFVMTRVHADAPALGFMLLGASFLLRCAVREPWSALRAACLAGVGVGLAITCKPNLVPAVFAFACWCFWFHGLRAATVLVGCAGITVAGIYGVTCILNDPRAVLLNFQVLAAFPWVSGAEGIGEKIRTLAWQIRQICIEAGAVVLAIAVALRPAARTIANRHLPTKPASVLAAFFLLLALTMLLPAAASVSKFGGDDNSWALFTLPLTLAAVFALSHLNSETVSASETYFLLLCFPGILAGIPETRLVGQIVRGIEPTLLGESYRLAMQCKNTCYLPFDPLAHMLAGDKFRPNLDVIYSYSLGGHPVNQTAFVASLPDKLEHVFIAGMGKYWGFNELQRLLPNFAPSPAPEFPSLFTVMTPSTASRVITDVVPPPAAAAVKSRQDAQR